MKNKLILKINNLEKNFGDLKVLKKVSQEIYNKEVTTIIGPSGSGKSTFLRCINLMEIADGGEIFLDDKDILKEKKTFWVYKKIGMVFQSFNLFQNKNVIDNLTLAPLLHGVFKDKKEATDYAKSILQRFSILDKEKEYPKNLSGGQSQRVAIARTLCMKPEIILFDEPTSALDPEMVQEVLDIIRKLRDDSMTMIIVTHLMAFAKEISDKILFMDEGVIVERGGSDFFIQAKEERTRAFLSKIL